MGKTNRTDSNDSTLNEKLKCIGYDYELLTANQQKYLLDIEEAIAGVFRREEEALAMMSGNNINIKRIAKDVHITRDTIYNNLVLKDYVEYRANEFRMIDMSAVQNDLKNENARLRTEVKALHLRDVDYEETKLQLAKAMTEIERLKQQLKLAQSGTGFGFSKTKESNVLQLFPKNSLKMISWNVNGLAACIEKGFFFFFQAASPDIMCIQETRIDSEKAEELSIQGYDIYWHHALKKGYSGTAIITRVQPVRIMRGIGIDRFDNEGRVLTAEFERFYLVNCYSPATQNDITRLQYRMDFDDALREYIRVLEATKPVIICGDFNVAHEEIDVESPFTGTILGITPEARQKFDKLLATGYDDAFRMLFPNDAHIYSWWPYSDYKRKKNNGLRLDYFITPEVMRGKLISVEYRMDIMGSDHCPVIMDINV